MHRFVPYFSTIKSFSHKKHDSRWCTYNGNRPHAVVLFRRSEAYFQRHVSLFLSNLLKFEPLGIVLSMMSSRFFFEKKTRHDSALPSSKKVLSIDFPVRKLCRIWTPVSSSVGYHYRRTIQATGMMAKYIFMVRSWALLVEQLSSW